MLGIQYLTLVWRCQDIHRSHANGRVENDLEDCGILTAEPDFRSVGYLLGLVKGLVV